MLGASSFLMVSALIIQSLFSRRAFWEFPLMEGQIDSYEIVITAFWSNEHNHQIVKEDRENLSWYACIYHQDMSRRKREQSNQTVSDYPTSLSVICLHSGLASCFYLLPVLVVTDGRPSEELSTMSELPGADFSVRVASSGSDHTALNE